VHPDVLGEPDRGNRVVVAAGRVPVVQVPHFGQRGETLRVDGLLSPTSLLRGQRDAQRADPAAGCVADHAAPATTDIEKPHPGTQSQLVGDQLVLAFLSLLEARLGMLENGAGVSHRGAQHQLVEPVGDIVVMVYRLGVPLP